MEYYSEESLENTSIFVVVCGVMASKFYAEGSGLQETLKQKWELVTQAEFMQMKSVQIHEKALSIKKNIENRLALLLSAS